MALLVYIVAVHDADADADAGQPALDFLAGPCNVAFVPGHCTILQVFTLYDANLL